MAKHHSSPMAVLFFFFLVVSKMISEIISSSFEVLGVQGLNPENDPEYIPAFYDINDDTFTPMLKCTSKDSIKSSVSECESWESCASLFCSSYKASPVGVEAIVDDFVSRMDKYENVPESELHVSEVCKKSVRQWNFYYGTPEEENLIKGWIARIVQADHLVKELDFPLRNSSLTLIPNKLYTKAQVQLNLSTSKVLEIKCLKGSLFGNLFIISSILEGRVKAIIMAVHIKFDVRGDFIIRIIIHGSNIDQAQSLRNHLSRVRSDVSEYKSY